MDRHRFTEEPLLRILYHKIIIQNHKGGCSDADFRFGKQYHQAISSGAETLTGTKGVENLVASLRSLTKGNIFEGTVTSVKNGRVTLSLSGGQQVMARLDGKISLMEGESMFSR